MSVTQVVPGSYRQVRVLLTDRAGWLYLLSALPLAIGLGVRVERWHQIAQTLGILILMSLGTVLTSRSINLREWH